MKNSLKDFLKWFNLPVSITVFRTSILLEVEMSIPSVFGLSSGAEIRRLLILTPLQPLMPMWFFWLLRCLKLLSWRPLQLWKWRACNIIKRFAILILGQNALQIETFLNPNHVNDLYRKKDKKFSFNSFMLHISWLQNLPLGSLFTI